MSGNRKVSPEDKLRAVYEYLGGKGSKKAIVQNEPKFALQMTQNTHIIISGLLLYRRRFILGGDFYDI